MEGLVKEGSEAMAGGFEDAVLDAGLIGAARRVEHYEMAALPPSSNLPRRKLATN